MKKIITSAAAVIAVASLAGLGLAGCSSDSSGTDSSGNLNLKVGELFPQTGTLSFMYPTLDGAAKLAVSDIESANAGIKVSLDPADEGASDANIAQSSAKQLIDNGDTVILGAAASANSKSIISTTSENQVVQISPSNTSPDFTTVKDDGYYFRTAPSDLLQGRALADQIVKDGKKNVSILFQNDSYGSGLKDAVQKELQKNGITVSSTSFDPAAKDISAEVKKAVSNNPDALVAVCFDQFKSMVSNLQTDGYNLGNIYGTDGNNNTMKNGDISIKGATFSQPGPASGLDSFLKQVSDKAGKPLTSTVYAAETYDAVNLVALAALQAKSTDGEKIKENLQSVSEGGTACTSFADCAKLIKDGKDIDYNGKSGPIDFDKNGDVTKATISFYKVTGDDNSEAFVRQEEVTAS